MSNSPAIDQPYPGDSATAEQILRLARHYHAAAQLLEQLGQPRDPASRAPSRLSAIHAIELYLNALLLHRGHKPSGIRGLKHDLAARTELVMDAGLRLRLRTAVHLREMMERREYLVARYGPEQSATISQLNRLSATLEEVGRKVTAAIDHPPSVSRAASHIYGK